MAHHLFAAGLSLGLANCRGRDGPEQPNSGIPTNDDVAVKESGTWPRRTQGLGKNNHPNHPAGLVDYLGAFPVLETGSRAPIPPATSYFRCDPANNPESHSTQLTFFYAGTVNVFHNVSADQAQVILSLAGSGNTSRQTEKTLGSTTSSYKRTVTPYKEPSVPCGLQVQDPLQKMGPNMQENPAAAAQLSIGERLQASAEYVQSQELAGLLVPCQAMVPKALPLARKVSLTRFLEKRKERMRMMAPYIGNGSCRDVIYQRVDHLNTGTFNMFENGLWASPGMKKLGCDYRFVDGNSDEDPNWQPIYENSKQVSESESAT